MDRIGALISLVESWEDALKLRISFENRIRAIEQAGSTPHPQLVAAFENQVEYEKAFRKHIAKIWREHPLAPFCKEIRGVGEHSAAMLVSLVGGDPSYRHDGTPRTVRSLWAYCGHGDPMRKRKRGMTETAAKAAGNKRAKSWTFLIADCMLKAGNRAVYDDIKEHYQDRVHADTCIRCGPSGKPALAGSPWSDKHKHTAALRYVGKQFLLDLWIEANLLHENGLWEAPSIKETVAA